MIKRNTILVYYPVPRVIPMNETFTIEFSSKPYHSPTIDSIANELKERLGENNNVQGK